MPKVEISREKIVEVLESKSPQSLTEIYRHLGGQGNLSGSMAKHMRTLVEGIDNWVANNKAKAGTSKAEGVPKGEEATSHSVGTAKKVAQKPAKAVAKSKYPRHAKNPFRPGSGYGLILDIIADAGTKGIGKPDLLKAYCKASGKDLTHAKYDLAVINSAREDSDKRHRSCADSFSLLKEGDCFRVRFE